MRQFVTFRLDDAIWGVPLGDVQEITRMPALVRVPRSSKSLEGLANLRGAVLPVASLRRLLRFADTTPGDSARVIVLDRGSPIGFMVDGTASLMSVAAREVAPAETMVSGIDASMLQGVFKSPDGSSEIGILDPDALLRRDFGRRRQQSLAKREAAAAPERSATAPGAANRNDLVLVSFELGRQEYALPLGRVREIVPLPASVSAIPRADTAVLGVTSLRDELIPLLSLHALLGFPVPEQTDERPRVLVVAFGDKSVGLVADRTKEILRVAPGLVDPVPAMLTRGEGTAELQSICRLDGGRRLVSVLSPDRLFGRESLPVAVNEVMDAKRTDMPEGGQSAKDEQQFVVFRLGGGEYAIPIDAIEEVTRRPDELTRVPKAPAFVEGVMNLRGAVIPVIDQRRRFDLPEAEPDGRQRVIVITFDGLRAGFLVDGVSELLKIPASAIGPAPELSEEQVRLISRVANLEDQNRMILIVDAPQLLDRQELGLLRKIGRSEPEPAS
ncbi:MAG TPA: chemotaxis protein CheW [Xanthobacteraceae bacterium]|nr:chemotaxis protein CheW [Xanthobacteraceae bacterium]